MCLSHALSNSFNVAIRYAVAILLCLSFAVGCANKGRDGAGNSISGVSSADADALNAEHSRFDAAKDPPLTAHTHFAAGQFAESQNATLPAIAQYREAIKIDPNHRASLYRLGVLYCEIKDYPSAIATWKQYIQATGDSAAGYANLGFCYELCARNADAEAAYKAGIAQNPAEPSCRVNYGLMLARLDRTDEAVAQLQTVLTPAEVHYNLASVYEQQGNAARARAEYQAALKADPRMRDAQQRLAGLDAE